MKYDVIWNPAAEADLAAAWLAAADRNAATAASFEIDRRLETSPLGFGESRESSVSRFAAVVPLAVWFEVVVDDKRVVVHAAAPAG